MRAASGSRTGKPSGETASGEVGEKRTCERAMLGDWETEECFADGERGERIMDGEAMGGFGLDGEETGCLWAVIGVSLEDWIDSGSGRAGRTGVAWMGSPW